MTPWPPCWPISSPVRLTTKTEPPDPTALRYLPTWTAGIEVTMDTADTCLDVQSSVTFQRFSAYFFFLTIPWNFDSYIIRLRICRTSFTRMKHYSVNSPEFSCRLFRTALCLYTVYSILQLVCEVVFLDLYVCFVLFLFCHHCQMLCYKK